MAKQSSDVVINPNEVISKVSGIIGANVNVEEVSSDKEGYQIKRNITIDSQVYTIYISNVNSSSKEDVEDNETETEYKTTYDGIITFNDVTYEFRACEKIETEVEENETETKLDMFIKLSDEKYIKVKQTKEVEEEDGKVEVEEKFEIELREQKSKTTLFKIKRCVEDNEEVIKLEMDNVEYTVKYFTKDGNNYVSIKVDDTKCVYQVVVNEDNVVTYEQVQ